MIVQHLVRDSDTDVSDLKGAVFLSGKGFGETRKIPDFTEG